jgi:hypothetical protein
LAKEEKENMPKKYIRSPELEAPKVNQEIAATFSGAT